MQVRVYEDMTGRVGRTITVAMIFGMVGAFSAFFLARRPVPNAPVVSPEAYPFMTAGVGIILFFLALISMVTGAQTCIERATGEVFRLDFVFGWEVRRQRFNLTDFDRVSLTRGDRTGYKVSLVGRYHDLLVLATSNFANARDQAEKIATECGLKVSDQL